MRFSQADVEMARRYYEEKLKITLGPYELKEEMMDNPQRQGDFVVIDVRNREGYEQEHIPGAINIPESELQEHLGEIPTDKELILYCWTTVCHLAAHAGLTLANNGYFAREMDGGIAEWKNYGYPVESGGVMAKTA